MTLFDKLVLLVTDRDSPSETRGLCLVLGCGMWKEKSKWLIDLYNTGQSKKVVGVCGLSAGGYFNGLLKKGEK